MAMASAAFRGALAGAVMTLGGVAWAGDPVLPSPRPLVTEVVGPISYVRPDPYAVWQNYAVDRQGRFRPLVAPYDGLRYVATGDPYPWWPEHPRYFAPTMANPATFGGPQAPLSYLPVVPPPVVSSHAAGWERMPYAEE
jgi:hypothetical protein